MWKFWPIILPWTKKKKKKLNKVIIFKKEGYKAEKSNGQKRNRRKIKSSQRNEDEIGGIIRKVDITQNKARAMRIGK